MVDFLQSLPIRPCKIPHIEILGHAGMEDMPISFHLEREAGFDYVIH